MAYSTNIPAANVAYLTGSTPYFSLKQDPRFSYALYIPSAHEDAAEPLPLVVIQHGSMRNAMDYRNVYVEAAEANGWVLLAPLFPATLDDLEGLHNYKYIDYDGVRYDEVLLAMVAEVGSHYNVETETFALHGFSGGGQFAHRFLYLHPERLSAVSIGAPGHVTLLTDRPWWVGTGDFEEIFGQPLQIEAMRAVPVQMVVGAEDIETWQLMGDGGVHWMDGAADAGRTRVERLHSLHESFADHGVSARLDVVDGLAHEGLKMGPTVIDFLTSSLSSTRSPKNGLAATDDRATGPH